MKKSWLLIVALATLFNFGCRQIDLVEAPETIPTVKPSAIAVELIYSGINGVVLVGDTLSVEKGTMVNFKAKSNGPKIVSWKWTFNDNGAVEYGQYVNHKYALNPPAFTSLKLSGTDSVGTLYEKVLTVKIVTSIAGLRSIEPISVVSNGSGKYNLVIALNKACMDYFGSSYFYVGTMTNWLSITIPAADTNWLVVGGTLISPNSGDYGKYVVVRLNDMSTNQLYEMGVGMMLNGQQTWGVFSGPFTGSGNLIRFYVLPNLTISPVITTPGVTVPGETGDIGDNAVIRLTVLDDRVIVYMNNVENFSVGQPFIRLQDRDGIWEASYLQIAVDSFPKWGKKEIMFSQIPDRKLVFRFGKNITQPTVLNSSISNSTYWDPLEKVLKIIFVQVINKAGVTSWQAVSVN